MNLKQKWNDNYDSMQFNCYKKQEKKNLTKLTSVFWSANQIQKKKKK